MARSDDTRHPIPFQRGARRYHDIGGHVPPGDDGRENSRDHERIWFEIRRHRSCCCDPADPGFRYCVGEKTEYPTLICDGYLLPDGALMDYFAGGGNNDGVASSWYLQAGCGSGEKAYSEPFGSAQFFEDGSWRNGPFVTGMSKPGLFQSTSEGWFGNFFADNPFSFEFWIKPSPSDIALGKFLTYSGPFKFLENGGLFSALTADGGVNFSQRSIGTVRSAADVFTADQWHHVVYVRKTTNGGSFSIFVNGVRVLYTPLALGLSADGDNTFGYGGASGSQWSDIARYSTAISASAIFRHYRALADDYGLAPPTGSDPGDDSTGGGGGVPDPGEFVFDLPPERIDGTAEEGGVMMSDGETGYWETPEGSPFELEARKGQADGYAALDSAAQVPSAQLAEDWDVSDPAPAYVLTKSGTDRRVWTPGQPVPAPTALTQMLRAEPASSDEYVALVELLTSGVENHWPLTEAAAPFGAVLGSGSLVVSAGSPAVVAGGSVAFLGESRVKLAAGDSIGHPGTPGETWDAARDNWGLWIKLDALPAADALVVGTGDSIRLLLLPTGQLRLVSHGTTLCTTTAALTVGEWTHIWLANDGGTPDGLWAAIWVNGVRDANGGGTFGTPWVIEGFLVGGDGLEAEVAHLTFLRGEWNAGDLYSDAQILALYQARRPVWALVDEIVGGSGGVDASEDDLPVTAAPRGRFNFKAGANVTVDVVDDEPGDEVEVTIAASAPAGSGIEVSVDDVDVSAAPRGRVNLKAGSGVTLTGTDDPVGDEVEVLVEAGPGGGAGLFDAYAYLRDEKPAGTNGGSSVADGNWHARDLTTEVWDTGGFVSLVGGTGPGFVLLPGSDYFLDCRAPFRASSVCHLRLYNVTDGVYVEDGATSYSTTADNGDSDAHLIARVTGLLVATTFEIRYRCGRSEPSTGLGTQINYGVPEVYTELKIFREA